MTLVAVWKMEDRIHAVADTRIGKGGSTLSEHGPKILSLPIVCMAPPATGGTFDQIVAQWSLGFAYSGATLPALSTHALATTLFSNLIALPDTPVPSLREIAQGLASISFHYINEVGQHSSQNPRFTSILFGYCLQTGMLRAVELRPTLTGPLAIELFEYDFNRRDDVVAIGTSVPALINRIRQLRESPEHQFIFDHAPRLAMKAMIAEQIDPAVGGFLQEAWALQRGFVPVRTAVSAGQTFTLNVLGLDVETDFLVGAYRVGMFGQL